LQRISPEPAAAYDQDCRRCPRLARFLAQARAAHPDYWARPVPSFGAPEPRILIVGLAPGMHGANRTGRPFTGDHAGILLYQTLYEAGLASRPLSASVDDGLTLRMQPARPPHELEWRERRLHESLFPASYRCPAPAPSLARFGGYDKKT